MKAVKYTFDNHFASDGRLPKPRAKAEPKYDAKMVEKISEDAFANGLEAGKAQAETEIAHQISECLDRISHQLHQLEGQEQARRQAAKRDTARLAHIIGAKLAAELISRQPLAEIEALVADCLETCRLEPKLVIRLNDALIEPMTAKIEEMRRLQHFEGEIVLLGDGTIPVGDGRIEWNDGGAARSGAALNETIGTIVGRYVQSIDKAVAESHHGALESAE